MTKHKPEDGIEEWGKGKFRHGRYTGQLYGNTDWAFARLVWSAALEYERGRKEQELEELRAELAILRRTQ